MPGNGLELATAYVNLTVSGKDIMPGVRKELAGVQGEADRTGKAAGDAMGSGMSDGVSKHMSRIGDVLKKATSAAVLGLGGLAVAGATVGVKTAAGMEQASISFTTMLGSAQKADSFLKDLAAFAAKTPFDLPGLQTAASSLISAGVDAKKVIPIMTSLGNATSGMGTGAEGVKRATVALQQMNAAGKITGEDLNQLRDAGIPVYDLLAAATGKSKEQVADLAAKGKLGRKELEQLMSALESGKGLERFSGLMDKQSQSLTGLVSTFKDTLNQGLATAVQPLIPLLKDGLGQATEFVAAQMPKLADGLASVVAKAPETAARLGTWRDTAVDAYNRVHEAVGGLFDLFGSNEDGSADRLSMALGVDDGTLYQAKDAVMGIVDSVKQFVGTVKSGDFSPLTDTFAKLGPITKDATASLPAVNSVLDTTSTVFGFVADHIDLVVKAIPFLLGAFAAIKVAQAANNVVGKESLVGFGLQLAQNAALVASHFALAAAIKGSTFAQEENTAASSGGLLAKLKDTAATVASTVAKGATAVATGVVTAAQWLWNAALSANPIALVVIGIAALVAAVIYAWNNFETFRNIVTAVWDAIKGAALAAMNWFTDTLWPTLQSVLQWVGDKAMWLWQNVIVPAWSGIQAAVSAVSSWLTGTFVPAVQRVWSDFESGITWLRDRVITPVMSAIQTIFQDTVDTIGRIWSGLQELAKAPIRFIINTVINDGLIGTYNTVAGWFNADKKSPVVIPGFDVGGWTGPGSKLTPAGIVHADEFVLRKESRRSVEATIPGLLDAMNRDGAAALAALGIGYAGGGMVAPVPGGHAPWGSYPGHTGLDYPVPTGTVVHAALDGVVQSVMSMATSYGNHIRIAHANGLETIYAHLQSMAVEVGQAVSAGTAIGTSDSTGNSTGPHLHFEVRRNGYAIDPTDMLTGAASPGGSSIVGMAADKVREVVSGLLDQVPFAGNMFRDAGVGAARNLLDTVVNWVKQQTGPTDSGTLGSLTGVQQWAPIVMQALGIVGQPGSMLETVLRRMNQESSGNPKAINLWDSNARGGTPSKGLMQVIDPTFAAYHLESLGNDIWDPLQNVVASMRYALSRYGSLAAAYNRAGGYSEGGRVQVPVFDRGGVLAPGVNVVDNRTGGYESLANVTGGVLVSLDGVTLQVVDVDGVLVGSMRTVAGQTVRQAVSARAAAVRASR